MTGAHIPKRLREQIAAEAGHRCGYCLTSQDYTAMPMEIEHIIPRVAGGPTVRENLWLACPLCNGHKAAQTHGVDLETDERVSLFNPRKQAWREHFTWSDDGTLVIGLTACGRATVVVLQLNNEYFVQARRRWMMAGWHPPQE
ncbi:MAG: HNH endonuclease [Anaerolineae bacterium CG2_30_64_16]|nr:MAG: HNH endonuclease [Anaerolineae bacterium CG2_30_64_16]